MSGFTNGWRTIARTTTNGYERAQIGTADPLTVVPVEPEPRAYPWAAAICVSIAVIVAFVLHIGGIW